MQWRPPLPLQVVGAMFPHSLVSYLACVGAFPPGRPCSVRKAKDLMVGITNGVPGDGKSPKKNKLETWGVGWLASPIHPHLDSPRHTPVFLASVVIDELPSVIALTSARRRRIAASPHACSSVSSSSLAWKAVREDEEELGERREHLTGS